MLAELSTEQLASLSAEQQAEYLGQPIYMRGLVGRQIIAWNAEQRRLRQIERKRRLRNGEMTRGQFDAAASADPEPPADRAEVPVPNKG